MERDVVENERSEKEEPAGGDEKETFSAQES
jgi:hypothetical protein